MPNKDGTGPEGKGPKTGRQMGKCADAKPVKGQTGVQGLGPCGHGRGRGLGRKFQRTQESQE